MCCYALWYCQRIFCNASDLDLQCWWKTKKININILIAKRGACTPSAPPGCAFACRPGSSPVALSVPLMVAHVSPPCIHELRYYFVRPYDTFVVRTWEGYFMHSEFNSRCVWRLNAFVKHTPAFELWLVVVTRYRSRLK